MVVVIVCALRVLLIPRTIASLADAELCRLAFGVRPTVAASVNLDRRTLGSHIGLEKRTVSVRIVSLWPTWFRTYWTISADVGKARLMYSEGKDHSCLCGELVAEVETFT